MQREKEAVTISQQKLLDANHNCNNIFTTADMPTMDEVINENDDDDEYSIDVMEETSSSSSSIKFSLTDDIINSDMGKIHSQKSLEVLVEKSKNKILLLDDGEKSLNPPIIIKHSEDNGARLAQKTSLNKLPYKNRNPSV